MGATKVAWSKGYTLKFLIVHKNLQNANTSSLPFLTVSANPFQPYNEKLRNFNQTQILEIRESAVIEG